jgi:hypothetical protein
MICDYCDGKGKIKVPIDEKMFDREVNRLADPGTLTLGESIDRAFEKSGYTWETCPECGGTGKK